MDDNTLVTLFGMMMPPYICKCGREMGVKPKVKIDKLEWEFGCQPGRCLFEEEEETKK